jgi:uncharacterized protein
MNSSDATVYLPDVNVLIAALHPNHEFHRPAISWLESGVQFVTTSVTETGFLRLSTNSKVTGSKVSLREALSALRDLRADDHWRFWPEIPSLVEPKIDIAPMIGPKQVTDFLLVNLAAENNGKLATYDGKIKSSLHPRDQRWVHVLVP